MPTITCTPNAFQELQLESIERHELMRPFDERGDLGLWIGAQRRLAISDARQLC